MIAPSPTGIVLPDFTDDPTQRKFGTENLQSGRAEGFGAESAQGLHDSVLGQGFGLGVNALYSTFAPGKFMSPEQWKSSPHFRPGLNFPHGVGENVARIKAADFDAQQEREATIGSMPDGVVSGAAKLAGGALGFVAGTPFINVAAGTIGRSSSQLLAGLAEKGIAGKAAASAIEGAIVGAGITEPQEALHLANSSLYGDDYSGLEALTNVGANAALGGLIHLGAAGAKSFMGAKKPFQPITAEADRVAKEAAVSQVAEGKSVNVEPVVKQGFNDARASETPEYKAEVEESLKEVNEKITVAQEKLRLETETLDKTFNEQVKFSTLMPEEHLSALDIARKVVDIESLGPAGRTLSDNLFLKQLTKTPEIEEAISGLSKSGFNRTAQENLTLKFLEQGKENQLIETRLSSIDERLKELNERIDETKNKKKKDALIGKKESLEEEKARSEKRLSDLKPKGEKLPVRQQQERVNAIRQELAELQELKQNHEVALEAMNRPIEPVTKQDVLAHNAKIDSIDSDSGIDSPAIDAFIEDAENLPDNFEQLIPDMEEKIAEMKKQGLLQTDEVNALDELKKYDSNAKRLKDVFRSAIECLINK